jgi:hypothetical protein
MATIKSHTDLPQSKTLSKILSHESADMCYYEYTSHIDGTPKVGYKEGITEGIPCWSLSALLAIFPDHLYFGSERMQFGIDKMGSLYNAYYEAKHSFWQTRADNPIDACYEMVLKLKEKNLL